MATNEVVAVIQEAICCDVCGETLVNTPLYKCSFDECKQGGRILCGNGCGVISHRLITDHTFDTEQEYVQEVKGMNLIHISKLKRGQAIANTVSKQPVIRQFQQIKKVALYSLRNVVHQQFIHPYNAEIQSMKITIPSMLCTNGTWICSTEGDAMVSSLSCAIDIGYELYQYMNDKNNCISKQELMYQTSRIISSHIGGYAGSIGGHLLSWSVWGKLIEGKSRGCGSTLTGQLLTTIGNIIGAIAFSYVVDKLWDRYYPNLHKIQREKKVHDAFKYFQFTEKDRQNTEIFNKKELYRRYRHFSKIHHPDCGGSDDQFCKLQEAMGILLVLISGAPKVQPANDNPKSILL